MENRPNNGRKKTTGKGSGTVHKKDEKVEVHGPVGREDGYQGKAESQQAAQNAAQNAASDGDKGIGSELLGSLLGGSLGGSSQGSSSSSGLGGLGSILGGGSGQQQGGSGLFNTQPQQSQQSQQSSGGGILGGFGSTTGGSGQQQSSGRSKSPLMKILLLIGIIIIGYLLLKSCMGGGQGCAIDMSGMNGGDTIIQNGGSNGDTLQGYLSGSYDASDATAPQAAYSSTSGSGISQLAVTTAPPSNTTTLPVADTSVSNQARAKRTQIKGNGQDEVTIMVFMCGTDLESKYGMATNDLNEMLHAKLNDDKVNVIVETGGTKTWKNSVVSNSTNQRYRVTSRGLQVLDNNLGRRNMTDPNTLSDFIKFCKANYPADRYCLIFWDHGGGSLSGYGYDQYYQGSMTLDKVNKALYDGGCVFDFIGFDACLMATLETAIVAEQYGDYLIGSEETEPGCGWYYTNWLTALSQNTSIPTVELAKIIIDDFNDVCRKNNCGDSTTLSVTDLAEFIGTVPEAFRAFSTSVTEMLNSNEYQVVANARGRAKEFGAEAGINHVDLIHLAKGIADSNASGSDEARALINALAGCIKYNRTSVAMKNSYGMSIYFPYSSFKSVNSAVNLYNAIGVDSRYSEAIKNFASMAAGGQIATGQTSSPIGSLLGNFGGTSSSSSSSDILGQLLGGGSSSSGGLLESLMGGGYSNWFDSGRVLSNADYYDAHAIYSDDMYLTDKSGGKVLMLSEAKWEMVQDIQLNLFLDDGKGYIDMGMDNVYEFDGDGDLKIDFDGTWLALDGHIVPYYMESNTEDGDMQIITGRVPARLNGTDLVYVMLVFEYDSAADKSNDYVAGARYIYEHGETETVGKGLIELHKGDKLEFICDYYGYDGSYDATYVLEDALTLDHDMDKIVIENLRIEGAKAVVTYCLTDMYHNEFWTESVEF